MSDSPWGPPPPSQDPYGQQPGQQPGGPNPYANPYSQPGHAQPGATAYGAGDGSRDPDRRPGTVTAAAIITWITAGTSALLLGLTAIAMFVARDSLADDITRELETDPAFRDLDMPTGGELAGMLGVGMAVLAVWCLVACVLAVMAMRRSNAGRIMLVVSSAISALLSLLAILSLVSAVTLFASIAVIVLLFAGGAGDWYARRSPQQHHLPPGTAQY